MTISFKNAIYAFLIRLDLMLSMSLWKEFKLLQILNDLSTKHLIKLILYESDVKLLKFKREILVIDTWNEYIKKGHGMVNLFFYRKFNVKVPLI